MKFLAILRDSLRETLDVKILYVLVGLSLLTLLLVGSITYRPVSVERRLTSVLQFQNTAFRANPELNRYGLRIEIENFQRRDDRAEPWLGDYDFDYVFRASQPPDDDATNKFRELRRGLREGMRPEFLKRELGQFFRQLEVTSTPVPDPPPDGEILVYHVSTRDGMKIKSQHEWFHEPILFFSLLPLPIPFFSLNAIIWFIGTWVIGTFGGAFTLAISLIVTASFLPGMLTKGTVDLLLVKPIHRSTLLVYKFLGGLLFVLLNTAVLMTGLWLVIGWQTGAWLGSLLVCIPVFTLQFAVLYSVSALAAVLTRSAIVCILVSFAAWALLFALGYAHWAFIENRRESATEVEKAHWARVGFDALYTLTPRFKEMDWLTSRMIETELARVSPKPAPGAEPDGETAEWKLRRAQEILEQQDRDIERRYGSYSWTTCLIASGAFIVVMLTLACWRFAVKDY